jgi:hypothetical protein
MASSLLQAIKAEKIYPREIENENFIVDIRSGEVDDRIKFPEVNFYRNMIVAINNFLMNNSIQFRQELETRKLAAKHFVRSG